MRNGKFFCCFILVIALLCSGLCFSKTQPLPIIPGAAGFGMDTPAGSGRHLATPWTQIIRVTTLGAAGPGTLRAALETKGPRVVVFEVSGNIDFTPYGDLSIKYPYVTVAGQTAPSPGITLKGCQLQVRTHDVLIQHIRIRVGDLLDPSQPLQNKAGWSQWSERDCMKIGGDRVIIDHCSFSWATDENVQTRGNDLTFHRNVFSEALHSALHHKGGHSRALLILNQGAANTRHEGQRIAVVGNLFAHNIGRNPTVMGGVEAVVVNNLVDNANFAIKADCAGRRGHQFVSAIGNVVKRTGQPFVARAMHPDTRYYFAPENILNGQTFDSVDDVWKEVSMPFKPGVAKVNRAADAPIAVPGLAIRPPAEVEEWVLANAGARPLDRDQVDTRVVQSVRDQTGSIISSQDDVGNWPELREDYIPLLLPEGPHRDDDGDGYTNLEEWLHDLAAKVEKDR